MQQTQGLNSSTPSNPHSGNDALTGELLVPLQHNLFVTN
nr:MAG TPA: hypothetical protein [Bacteriophage sp.]